MSLWSSVTSLWNAIISVLQQALKLLQLPGWYKSRLFWFNWSLVRLYCSGLVTLWASCLPLTMARSCIFNGISIEIFLMSIQLSKPYITGKICLHFNLLSIWRSQLWDKLKCRFNAVTDLWGINCWLMLCHTKVFNQTWQRAQHSSAKSDTVAQW